MPPGEAGGAGKRPGPDPGNVVPVRLPRDKDRGQTPDRPDQSEPGVDRRAIRAAAIFIILVLVVLVVVVFLSGTQGGAPVPGAAGLGLPGWVR